jgi:hypothetical protein
MWPHLATNAIWPGSDSLGRPRHGDIREQDIHVLALDDPEGLIN